MIQANDLVVGHKKDDCPQLAGGYNDGGFGDASGGFDEPAPAAEGGWANGGSDEEEAPVAAAGGW